MCLSCIGSVNVGTCHYHPKIHLQPQLFPANFLVFSLNPRGLTRKVSRRVVVSVIFLTNPQINSRLWLTRQRFLQILNLQIQNIFLSRINLSLTGLLIMSQINILEASIFFWNNLWSGHVEARLLLFNLCIEIRLWFITL